MIVGMSRAGGFGPGADELEVDDDGSWKALRSAGSAVGGRFGGQLDPDVIARLHTEAEAAASAGPPVREDAWSPGAVVDTFWAGEVVAQIEREAPLPGPWEPVAAFCRSQLEGAVDAPLAAVQLEPAGEATLRHVGSEALSTDGSGFSVEATLTGPDSSTLGSWTTTVDAPEVIEPGWETTLGLGRSGFHPEGGQTIGLNVTFTMVDGLPRPVALWAST